MKRHKNFILALGMSCLFIIFAALSVPATSVQREHFDYEQGIQPPPPPDSCVTWHQIWPPASFCTYWHQDGWVDNGDGILSRSDTLEFSKEPMREEQKRFHIENVTRTLTLTLKPELTDTFYLEFLTPSDAAPWDTFYWEPVYGVTSSKWHVVWPPDYHCQVWHLTSFEDNNGNGIIDFSDQIDFETPEGTKWFHVERVSTDIEVTNVDFDVPTLSQWGLIALLIVLAGVATWVVLKRRKVVTA